MPRSPTTTLLRRLGSSSTTNSSRRLAAATARPPSQAPSQLLKCSLATAAASAVSEPQKTTTTGYVSPHDWTALVRDYGKSDAAVGSAPMEIQTLQATARTPAEAGSRYSQRARQQGKLPGVLYGPGADGDQERYLVTVERREIEKQMRRLGDSVTSTVFELAVDKGDGGGATYKQRVLVRDLDRDPGTAVPIAVNFLRYRPGYPVEVPVCFVNEELCLPLKRGGMLLSINRFIRVACEGETIPEMLLVDLTGIRSNQKIGLERVAFPAGVQPYEVSEQYVLGVVKGKNLGPAAAAAEAEAATTAA